MKFESRALLNLVNHFSQKITAGGLWTDDVGKEKSKADG